MSEVKYAIAILKEKLGNADKHNLQYQRLSIVDMETIWGVLSKCETDYAELKAQRDALAAEVHNCRGFVADHLGPEAELQFSGLNTDFADSILNSVRAEGIEILTGKLQQLVDEGTFDAKEIGVAAGTIHEGAQIAAQLRAGKDDE